MKTGRGAGRNAVVLSALLVAIWSAPALAYIDPGTGSAAYQVLLTGFLAVGYAIRRFFGRASQTSDASRVVPTDARRPELTTGLPAVAVSEANAPRRRVVPPDRPSSGAGERRPR